MARGGAAAAFAARRLLLTSPSRSRLYQNAAAAAGARHHHSCMQKGHPIFRPILVPKHDNLSSLMHVDLLRRLASKASKSAEKKKAASKISLDSKKADDIVEEIHPEVVYYGPVSATLKKLKLLTLSTCCLSVSLGPVLTFLILPEMNVILKGALSFSATMLSAFATVALHWFSSPYIHKLKWHPGSDYFEVEMLSWLATHIPRTIKFADVKPANTNRRYVTFEALGQYYFVDKEHCHNKALYARLAPTALDSAFKNL